MAEILSLRKINSKTFDLGNGQRRLSTSLGVIHYPDALGQWQDCDDSYSEADGLDGFSSKFTKCFHHVRIGDNGTRRIYPDRNDLSYWIQLEKPDGITMGTPTKSGNTWVWDFLHARIKVQVQSARVKFNFILKDALAPTSITIPFSVQGITRTGSTLYHAGIPCGELVKPTAEDANGIKRDTTVSFGAGSVTLSLDTTGLAFPIDLDPTVNLQVGASDDDCIVRQNTDTSVWSISLTDGEQCVGRHTANANQKMGGGMRFLNVTVPQGATIDSAALTITAAYTYSATTINSVIIGEDADNAATFSNIANYQARRGTLVGGADDTNITSASVTWNAIPAWTAETEYTSPSIVTVVQEIVNRAGWASGNAMVIFWDDHANNTSPPGGVDRRRIGYSYNTSTTKCAKLDITYTAGETVIPITLSLNDTQYAPPINFGFVPAVLSHTTSLQNALTGFGYVPTTLSQTTNQFIPVLGLDFIPGKLTMTTTTFAPPIGFGFIPEVLAFLTSRFVPLITITNTKNPFKYGGRLTGVEKIKLAHGRKVDGYYYEHRVFDHTL